MKKLVLLIALILTTSMAFSQTWFQASIEHKFNAPAGVSISNELGYNFMMGNASIAPSLDYTYFPVNDTTQTLLFQCLTATYLFPIKDCDVTPYVSVTGTHLDAFAYENGKSNAPRSIRRKFSSWSGSYGYKKYTIVFPV